MAEEKMKCQVCKKGDFLGLQVHGKAEVTARIYEDGELGAAEVVMHTTPYPPKPAGESGIYFSGHTFLVMCSSLELKTDRHPVLATHQGLELAEWKEDADHFKTVVAWLEQLLRDAYQASDGRMLEIN